jgi:hypothetical protein
VYAIHGTGIDAGSVLCPDAGFCNDKCHGSPPLSFTVCLPQRRFNSLRMEPTIEKISVVSLNVANIYEVRAILQR